MQITEGKTTIRPDFTGTERKIKQTFLLVYIETRFLCLLDSADLRHEGK